jgi:hypothetical protein
LVDKLWLQQQVLQRLADALHQALLQLISHALAA